MIISTMHWLNDYSKNIAAISKDGEATELSYRTAIDNLLCAAANELDVATDILQEPSRTKNLGAPDFRITAKGGGIIGYVECKKPGEKYAFTYTTLLCFSDNDFCTPNTVLRGAKHPSE